MRKLLLLIACCLLHSQILAYEDGNELLSDLRSENFASHAGSTQYISGVFQTWRWIWREGKSEVPPFCAPRGVTKGQLRDIVKKYLDAQPEVRHMNAEVIVLVAVREAFPCKK